MVSIARSNMLSSKVRFGFSVAGVAVATLLLSFILALYRGWSERLTAYLDNTDADLWVVQKGNESFFSPSVIRDANQATVQHTDGVMRMSSLVGRTLRMHHGSGEYDIYVMGFQPQVVDQPEGGGSPVGGLGGPLKMESGSGTPRPGKFVEDSNGVRRRVAGEIVIDDVLAKVASLGIGDEIDAAGLPFKVVGISSGGNLGITLLCFVDIADAGDLIGGYPIVSYILVKTAAGQQNTVAASIEKANPSLRVFAAQDFAASSRKVLQRTLLPVLGVVVGLIFAVGAIVVGLTIYTATVEKEREFGVLKALGTPNRSIFWIVIQQTLVCSLTGFVIGEVGVIGATRLAPKLVPQFVTLVKLPDVGIVFAAALLMSLFAAWLPIRRITRVDPLAVFKA
jgi:putative ABC transport system permease protein